MLHEFIRPLDRPLDYDRSQTVGASEIGGCARKAWFAKHGAEPDPEYVDGWGFKERGHVVEEWAIRTMRANGACIEHALDEQVTLVDGFISATPDGLLDGQWSLDVKSFDPRKNRIPEPAHIMQVKVAAHLWHSPDILGSVLLYINASDYSDIREFIYPIEPSILDVAKQRAREIMSARSHADLVAEGWIAQDCDICPFAIQCVGKKPTDKGTLSPEHAAEIEHLTAKAKEAKAAQESAEITERTCKRQIMELLRAADVRRVPKLVRTTVSKGKASLDTEAMERDGIDLSLYRKAGRPSESVTLE